MQSHPTLTTAPLSRYAGSKYGTIDNPEGIVFYRNNDVCYGEGAHSRPVAECGIRICRKGHCEVFRLFN